MKAAALQCLLVAPLLLLFPGFSQATIEYTVSVANPDEHIIRVSMTIPDAEERTIVQIPAWNALYQIRDFSYRLQEVRAQVEGGNAVLRKLDKQTWQVAGWKSRRRVTITYGAEWDEASPFSTQLNGSHAFINFAMILMYAPERRSEDVRVTFAGLPPDWKVGAQLKSDDSGRAFTAKNYDDLVDAPAELGRFDEFTFDVRGGAGTARIRVIAHAHQPLSDGDRQKLQSMLSRVVATETELMRDVPFDEYLFLYHFGEGGGGMEHAYSTAIHAGSIDAAMGVTAHEFFHLWNVKRIRPRTLEPVDFTRENWTRALWFAEGVTSTYGNYTLLRSGLWSRQQYLADLAGEISKLEARRARTWKSVEEASLDAWLEKYRAYHAPAYSISYYNKGQILGVLLDILIRDATQNRKSLDDVLRHLNEEFARKRRYYDDSADIRAAAESVAGRSFEEFFARYVAGTDDLPYDEIFARAGLRLKPRTSDGPPAFEELAEATPLARRIREGLLRGITDE